MVLWEATNDTRSSCRVASLDPQATDRLRTSRPIRNSATSVGGHTNSGAFVTRQALSLTASDPVLGTPVTCVPSWIRRSRASSAIDLPVSPMG